ncbi:hypothetical protein DQ240_00725 [Blastococcus sp. TF02A-26]|nr:hypothetical protein DQ240_00725 [Blastococcus sp. TF02A-26]
MPRSGWCCSRRPAPRRGPRCRPRWRAARGRRCRRRCGGTAGTSRAFLSSSGGDRAGSERLSHSGESDAEPGPPGAAGRTAA